MGDGVEPIEFLDKQPGTVDNAPDFREQYWVDEFIRAGGIIDNEDRSKALAALAIYYVDENPYMQLPAPFTYAAWWPWVNNYFGETDTGFVDTEPHNLQAMDRSKSSRSNWATTRYAAYRRGRFETCLCTSVTVKSHTPTNRSLSRKLKCRPT